MLAAPDPRAFFWPPPQSSYFKGVCIPWVLEPARDQIEEGKLLQFSRFQALAEWSLDEPMLELFMHNHGEAEPTLTEDLRIQGDADDEHQFDLRPAMIVKLVARRHWGRIIWTGTFACFFALRNAASLICCSHFRLLRVLHFSSWRGSHW